MDPTYCKIVMAKDFLKKFLTQTTAHSKINVTPNADNLWQGTWQVRVNYGKELLFEKVFFFFFFFFLDTNAIYSAYYDISPLNPPVLF